MSRTRGGSVSCSSAGAIQKLAIFLKFDILKFDILVPEFKAPIETVLRRKKMVRRTCLSRVCALCMQVRELAPSASGVSICTFVPVVKQVN